MKFIIIIMPKEHDFEKRIAKLSLTRNQTTILIKKLIQYRSNGFENYEPDLEAYIKSEKITQKTKKIFSQAKKHYENFIAEVTQIEMKISYTVNIYCLQVLDWLYHRASYLFKYYAQGFNRVNTAFVYQKICSLHWDLLQGNSGNAILQIQSLCQALGIQIKQTFFKTPLMVFDDPQTLRGTFLTDKNLSNCIDQLNGQIQMLKIEVLAKKQPQTQASQIYDGKIKLQQISLTRSKRMRDVSNALYSQFNTLRSSSLSGEDSNNFVTAKYKILLYLSRLAKCAQMYLQCIATDFDELPQLIYIDASYITEIYKIYFFSNQSQPTALSTQHLAIILKQLQNSSLIDTYASTKLMKNRFKVYFFQHSLNLTSDKQIKNFLAANIEKNQSKLSQINGRGYQIRKRVNQQLKPIIRQLRNRITIKDNKYEFKDLVTTQLYRSLIESANILTLQISKQRVIIQKSGKFLIYLQILRQRKLISQETFQNENMLTHVSFVLPNYGQYEQLSKSIKVPVPVINSEGLKQRITDFLTLRIAMLQKLQSQSNLQNIVIISDQAIQLSILLKSITQMKQLDQTTGNYFLKQINRVLNNPVDVSDFHTHTAKYCGFLAKFKLTFGITLNILWYIFYDDRYVNINLRLLASANLRTYIDKLKKYFQLMRENEGMLQAFLIFLVFLDNNNRQNADFLTQITNLMREIRNITYKQFYQRFCTFYVVQKTDYFSKTTLLSQATKFKDTQKFLLYAAQNTVRPSHALFAQKPSFIDSVSSVHEILGQQSLYKKISKQVTSIMNEANQTQLKLERERISQLQKELTDLDTIQKQQEEELKKLNSQHQRIGRQMAIHFSKQETKWVFDQKFAPKVLKGLYKDELQSLRSMQTQDQNIKSQYIFKCFEIISKIAKNAQSMSTIKYIQTFLHRKIPVLQTLQNLGQQISTQVKLKYTQIVQLITTKKAQITLALDTFKSNKDICQQSINTLKHKKLQRYNIKIDKIDQMKFLEIKIKKQYRQRRGKFSQTEMLEKKIQQAIELQSQIIAQKQKERQLQAKQQVMKDQILHNISVLQLIISKYQQFFTTLLGQIIKINDQLKLLVQEKLNKKVIQFIFNLSQLIAQIHDIGQMITQVHLQVMGPKLSNFIIEYKKLRNI